MRHSMTESNEIVEQSKEKWLRSKTPEQKRAEIAAKYQSASVNLIDELESMKKVIKFQRECIEGAQFEGMGAIKKNFVDPKITKAVADLTLALTRTVEAKIKLDKHLKKASEESTPEEERATIIEYINSLDQKSRRLLLLECIEYHNSQSTNVNNKVGENDVK